jgi:hypothetical protein
MNILGKKTLRVCGDPDSGIVLARVAKARIRAPGTRSEAVILDLDVERKICGDPPTPLSVWSYTSRGNTFLKEGQKYVVVFTPTTVGPVRHGLGDFIAVPEGKEAEIVDAHLAALARKGGGHD